MTMDSKRKTVSAAQTDLVLYGVFFADNDCFIQPRDERCSRWMALGFKN